MHDGFEGHGLMPELIRAIGDMEWTLPTDVQDEAIPLILGGGDVMVAAETGSGKTGAFALPAIQLVHEARRAASSGSTGKKRGSSEAAGAGAPDASASGGGVGGHSSGSAARTADSSFRLNPEDRSSCTAIDPASGLAAQSRQQKVWGGVRTIVGVRGAGKYYCEWDMRDEGLSRVGWASSAASFDLGTDNHGFGFGGTGKNVHAKKYLDYGEAFGKGDVIGCYLDLDLGRISYSKNGKLLGEANKLPVKFRDTLYATACLKNAEVGLNLGATPFKYAPGHGFIGIVEAAAENIVINSGEDASVSRDRSKSGPLAIILEPSKDLAEQVYQEIDRLKKYVIAPELRHALLIGGEDARKQEATCKRGLDIVVGTPHRIMDFVTRGKLNVSNVRMFILDEADQLCERDTLPLITQLFAKLPKGAGVSGVERLQVAFFSATLHSESITTLGDSLCQHPTWVDLKGHDAVPDTVDHVVVSVDPTTPENLALAGTCEATVPIDGVHTRDAKGGNSDLAQSNRVKLLKPALVVKLIDSLNMEQAIIFCRTNVDCNHMERYLTERGGGRRFGGKVESGKENPYSACVLAGMRNMRERRRNLQAFKDGDVRFMICTDVAARGIDVQDLPFVINMTLPDDDRIEDYIHRIGRVGRADRMGLAVSLVSTVREKVWYHRCKNFRGQGCTNTRLINKGGCCKWFDEPRLLKLVEKRLGNDVTIPTMTETATGFRLPRGVGEGVTYGEMRKDVTQVSAHVIALAPTVSQLADLEVEAQTSFFALKHKFAGAHREEPESIAE